jgi:hypothetical protein
MGTYTNIRHPEDGRELQIHTGWDDCDYYNVGDTVDWSLSPLQPGCGTLLDGAYPSYSERGDDDWVIIKDHKVHAVIPRGEDIYEGSLWKRFALQSPPRDLWTEEAWAEKEKRQELARAEYEDFRRSIAHLPPKEQLAMALARPLMRRLEWAGIGKEVFKIEPLPERREVMAEKLTIVDCPECGGNGRVYETLSSPLSPSVIDETPIFTDHLLQQLLILREEAKRVATQYQNSQHLNAVSAEQFHRGRLHALDQVLVLLHPGHVESIHTWRGGPLFSDCGCDLWTVWACKCKGECPCHYRKAEGTDEKARERHERA